LEVLIHLPAWRKSRVVGIVDQDCDWLASDSPPLQVNHSRQQIAHRDRLFHLDTKQEGRIVSGAERYDPGSCSWNHDFASALDDRHRSFNATGNGVSQGFT
jgi:hypothetical protein